MNLFPGPSVLFLRTAEILTLPPSVSRQNKKRGQGIHSPFLEGSMKRSWIVVLGMTLILGLTASAFAGENPDRAKVTFNKELVEANLLKGVASTNFGLRTSSAMMLGKLKSEKALFALMKMLRMEDDERGRIVAALSLYNIGDSVGLYAVKQQARFDKSERVRKLCALFYLESRKVASAG